MSAIESIVSVWVWGNSVTLTIKQRRTKKANAKIKTVKLSSTSMKTKICSNAHTHKEVTKDIITGPEISKMHTLLV